MTAKKSEGVEKNVDAASGAEAPLATTETTAVATVAPSALPTELSFMNEEDFGNSGFEGTDKDSYAIPFIQLLQKMSPLVDEDDPKYLPGAKAGMFLNTVTQRLYDGKTGIIIIPCAYKRSYILWGGREGDGGFKGEFEVEEIEALRGDETKIKVIDGKMYVPNEDGSVNEKKNDYYADTRSHYVIVVDSETGEYANAILSLASSQIKASKMLMTMLSQKKVQTSKGMQTPPTFANLVKLTSIGKSNDKGSWSGASFELVGMVNQPHLYNAGREFYKQVVSGSVAADYSKADASTAQAEHAGGPEDAEKF